MIHDLQITAYHGTRWTVPDRVPAGAAVMVIELLGTRLSLAGITVGGEAAYSLRRTRLSEAEIKTAQDPR